MVVLLAAVFVDPKSWLEFMSLNTLILFTDDFMKKVQATTSRKTFDWFTTFIRGKCFLFRSVINFVSQICPIIKFLHMIKNDLCA